MRWIALLFIVFISCNQDLVPKSQTSDMDAPVPPRRIGIVCIEGHAYYQFNDCIAPK
jgi:hypothetical protein